MTQNFTKIYKKKHLILEIYSDIELFISIFMKLMQKTNETATFNAILQKKQKTHKIIDLLIKDKTF